MKVLGTYRAERVTTCDNTTSPVTVIQLGVVMITASALMTLVTSVITDVSSVAFVLYTISGGGFFIGGLSNDSYDSLFSYLRSW